MVDVFMNRETYKNVVKSFLVTKIDENFVANISTLNPNIKLLVESFDFSAEDFIFHSVNKYKPLYYLKEPSPIEDLKVSDKFKKEMVTYHLYKDCEVLNKYYVKDRIIVHTLKQNFPVKEKNAEVVALVDKSSEIGEFKYTERKAKALLLILEYFFWYYNRKSLRDTYIALDDYGMNHCYRCEEKRKHNAEQKELWDLFDNE